MMTQPSSPAVANDSFSTPKKSPARHALSLTFLGLTLGLVTWAGQVLLGLVSKTEFSQLISHDTFLFLHSIVDLASSLALLVGVIWLTRFREHAPKLAAWTRNVALLSVVFNLVFPFVVEIAFNLLGHFLIGFLARVIVHTLCTYLIFRFCTSLIEAGPEPERAVGARKFLKLYLGVQGVSVFVYALAFSGFGSEIISGSINALFLAMHIFLFGYFFLQTQRALSHSL